MSKHQDSTMPSKYEICKYWEDKIFDLDFFIDWNEPSCWSCGEFWNGRYDCKGKNLSRNKILKNWEKAPLQRCHIIPRSLGGLNEPSNLFLMCKECHDIAPNTSFPDIFFQWARKQNFLERHAYRIQQSLTAFSIHEELYPKLDAISKTREFKDFAHKHSGLHRSQSGYSGVGRQLTDSTMIGLLFYYYENIYLASRMRS
jgi:hypothetical protein